MNKSFLRKLGIKKNNNGTWTGKKSYGTGEVLPSYSPVEGAFIGNATVTTKTEYNRVIRMAEKAFVKWRALPAPQRGEVVRQYGEALRKYKQPLGKLVSYEMGKSLQEGLGEVQEMIDMADFAVGISRQLYGLTIQSERPDHHMLERWHPMGIVGVISAFNFPVAVWAWNAMIAMVCGDVVVWKPSEKVPLCSIACMNILQDVLKANKVPEGVVNVINGDYQVGEWMTHDERIPLISATGSVRMGRIVGTTVAQRLGKSLLELGGNNAIIVTPSVDMELMLRGVVFGAVGTAGQRCTSTRRLIIHESIYDTVKKKLKKAYKQIKIGDPLDANNHMGPLIDELAVENYMHALKQVKAEGGSFLVKGGILKGPGYESGTYVKPVIAEVEPHFEIVQTETFAPILYLMKYNNIEEAIAINNGVPQGLSSAIMTNNLRESERFISYGGSECGIANVNIGTSGAEIGGAFGGEKHTGGGRESGSDAWKTYMRRQTITINYSEDLPLAQGIKFDF